MFEVFFTFIEFMEDQSVWSYIIILFYGLLVGSFLNVVIYRLPIMMNLEFLEMIKDVTELPDDTITSQMSKEEKKEYDDMMSMKGMSLSFPRSRCGNCGYKIPMWHNIPVISYLILGGKCKSCKESYSPIYILVELLIGLFWCISFYLLGATVDFLIITGVATALIASLFIDLEHKLLPDSITFAGMFAGLYYNISSPNAFVTAESAVLGVIFGYLIITGIVKGYEKLRGIGMMMGDGDLKLYAMCGAWVGLYNLTFLVLISTIIGLLQFAILLPFVKKMKEYQLPFGPAIIVTFFAFIYFNSEVVGFINQLGLQAL